MIKKQNQELTGSPKNLNISKDTSEDYEPLSSQT
jgi:hypothetical protein